MKDKKQESKAAFNQQAPTYDRDRRGRHARTLYPALLKKLSMTPFQKALDLGCGTGELLKLVLQADRSREIYGLDLSENMLEVARKKLGASAALALGDAEHLPFEDAFFDLVYCNDSFHHYPNPEKVLDEVCRVLKPKGVFLMGDLWHPGFARPIINFFMKHNGEGDVKIYSEVELRTLLSPNFQNMQWEAVSHTACIVSAKKIFRPQNE